MTSGEGSKAILSRIAALHPKKIDLALHRMQRLLDALDNPERKLVPVIHVAGTNGKGSACAFMRAMLEAQALRVHVHTSPHLVRFHERIRIAGELISEDELCATLEEVERANDGAPITFFEITNAAMFLAFSRHPADAVILEVGLGGTYDATNVVARPRMTVIQPIGMDHREFLGDSIAGIAAEKAGIIKRGVPVVVGPQEDVPREVILRRAARMHAPAYVHGQDFMTRQEQGRMVYEDERGLLDLPLPRLAGAHQIENAGVAIAALRHAESGWGADSAVEKGLTTVEWPARLQRLRHGPLVDDAPQDADVWLDGGHNAHGAQAVARAVAELPEASERPLYLIAGMLRTKDAAAYFAAFDGLAHHVFTIAIPGETASFTAEELAHAALAANLEAMPAASLTEAMARVRKQNAGENPARILVCGSLYLAGHVLAENG